MSALAAAIFVTLLIGGIMVIAEKPRRREVMIPLRDSMMRLSASFGGYYALLQLNTDIAEAVMVDKECGRHSTQCPRYCGDVAFAPILCPLSCQIFTPQTLVNICGERVRFDSTFSNTTEPIAGKWRRQFPGSRPLSGRLFSENMAYAVSTFRQNKWFRYDRSLRIRLVSAVFFDRRLLFYSSSILGLGPGPDSTMEALFQTEGIRTRKVTIVLSRLPHSIRLQKPAVHTFMFTVGGFDGYRCAGWELVPSISPSGWVVEATEMDLLGRVFRQKFMIRFSALTDYVLIPVAVMEELLDAGLLIHHRSSETRVFYAMPGKCAEVWIRLQLQGFQFEMKFPYQQFVNPERCFIQLAIDYNDPHVYWPVITLGMSFYQQWCLGFDYTTGSVAFGRRRERPAYPLLPEVRKR